MDDEARRIAFHLAEPDPAFLNLLAPPIACAVPPSVPADDLFEQPHRCFAPPVADVRRVQRILSEEHRIICSSRGGNLRVSIHLYNDVSDVDALVDALGSMAADGDDR